MLHGAQPDALVLCHDPLRRHMRGLPDFPVPGLEECLAANLQVARLTNPAVRAVGIAVNTSKMDHTAAIELCADTASRLGMPCCDPYRFGADAIFEEIGRCFDSSARAMTVSP